MKERVQGCVTAGVALVGAGVMAASPVAQQAPAVVKAADADVQLAAYTQSVPALFALSAQRSVAGLATTPIGLAAAAAALAQGQNEDAQEALSEIIDGPLWAADPAIYALDDLLPEPIGGDAKNEPTEADPDSAISQLRAAVLIAARDDMKEAVADALGVGNALDVDDEGAVYAAARLGAGFAASGVRGATSAVSAPLGLVAVAQGLQKSLNGDGNKDLYLALQAYIDGANYVIDPIVFAADDVLPQPIGGDTETDPARMNGSEISRLRANVLLAPRDNVRKVVAGALGVEPIKGEPLPSTSNTLSKVGDSKQDQAQGPVSRVITSLKATPGGAAKEAAGTGGRHRAPTTGLSNLNPFKKRETKNDSTPSETN
ncbi:hypothetical protein A5662_25600 [Mycobacteriaceae bacterium 1482268.1]|nr:hypothetical protein A5662_25600 [Mycobacteriaceae bacterium 1482268.1]